MILAVARVGRLSEEVQGWMNKESRRNGERYDRISLMAG
jgi:hypothetical protein